jgi:hypothetical protein
MNKTFCFWIFKNKSKTSIKFVPLNGSPFIKKKIPPIPTQVD